MNDALLYAIIGHLVGDFILQNDVQARGKKKSSRMCALHCGLWTISVILFSGWWRSLFAIVWLFATHFAIDRMGFVRLWMKINGQDQFATGPLSPWSIVAVDSIFHMLTLVVIDMLFRY